MTDSTPAACRSPLEHERDAGPILSPEALDALRRDLRRGIISYEDAIVIGGKAHDARCLAAADTIAALRGRLAEAEAAVERAVRLALERAIRAVVESAAIADHPNVYMGGATLQARRTAEAFADAIRDLDPAAIAAEAKGGDHD
jgi:hypothetical protein